MRDNIKQMNPATPEERDILIKTIEECAEVIQSCTKVLFYGFDSSNPDKPTITNREHLEQEVGDVMCLLGLLMSKNILSDKSIYQACEIKLKRLHQYSNIEVSV